MDRTMCHGFQAAGVAAGLKKKIGEKDLGLLYSEVPATVAGVFTRNRVIAAPVVLDKKRIRKGTCRAIIVNSGNANCCTGDKGMDDAVAMSKYVADALGVAEESVLVASTGVIGAPLPVEKIEAAVPELVGAIRPEGFGDLARAIMTTDTVPKTYSADGQIDDRTFTVTGIAKGSGMIRPDMATMLCFVCTDIAIAQEALQNSLSSSVNRSFNRITVDGDTSTNDTVLVMANGLSGVAATSPEQIDIFQKALDEVLIQLAKMVVKDGEGATKLVEIIVQGAASAEDAFRIADTVANSNLVKTALFGEDANWGRIIAAAGRAGVAFDPDRIDIFFNDVLMVKNGVGCGAEAEAEATSVLKLPEYQIVIDLNAGEKMDAVFTCDFSIDYVKINADYRS